MLIISNVVHLPDHEIELNVIHAQGVGGQDINEAFSATHLRFDIQVPSLPPFYKKHLLALNDQRISGDGVVTIKT